ncbi:hypothetical protein DM02DRAFT_76635 [Periconia macrospinosa]|uniref:Uncharacterized protein n=1 Tax=Periconia macrospinosa TaxID=97972 RepID=A0A2V1DI97_9PLEO|nr:hypothetical protein DM02DRAFT_76635 [Periconia macrospinosa]
MGGHFLLSGTQQRLRTIPLFFQFTVFLPFPCANRICSSLTGRTNGWTEQEKEWLGRFMCGFSSFTPLFFQPGLLVGGFFMVSSFPFSSDSLRGYFRGGPSRSIVKFSSS